MFRRDFLRAASLAAFAPVVPLTFPVRAMADKAEQQIAAFESYRKVVADTAAMVSDAGAQKLANQHGLQILNVTWEDTGRFKGSSVGPNISDMTIQVQQLDPRNEKAFLTCMPVIRFPNFADKTGDIRPYKFSLLVGNERGGKLRSVTLSEFLGDLRQYLNNPKSWKGDERSLLATRDTHVLVSAQACFLPIPKEGKAEFNPVLFNYQSSKGNPAVLTILATRQGTSVTIIDNTRDGFEAGATWGQRLFFNKEGQRASMTGERLSDFNAKPQASDQPSVKTGTDEGLNMVLLVQVPLKHKEPPRPALAAGGLGGPLGAPQAAAADGGPKRGSDVEAAVIGHGKVEGPFTEIDNLKIERDPRFPVRVTVQFYKATSNGVVNEKDMMDIAAQIKRVYSEADYVGSLVTQGDTGRPTEHTGEKFEPPGWWDAFWQRHQQNTGQTPAQAIEMLHKLYGPNWRPRDERELAAAAEAVRR